MGLPVNDASADLVRRSVAPAAASYRAHGYTVETTFSLGLSPAGSGPQPRAEGGVLRLVRGEDRPIPWTAPDGDVLAEVMDDDLRTWYCFSRGPAGVMLRFHGLADFVADSGLTDVTVHVDPAADPDLVPVLVNGTVLATRLVLDGRLVLHASALALDGGALAFVGSSGMGKSTMAALGLAAGYLPLSDDVLRVDLTGGGPRVWPGSSELRLRETARTLVGTGGGQRPTADGRTAMATGAAPDGPVPLRGCVVPLLDQAAEAITVERLEPFEALTQLLAYPRVAGWTDRASAREQFQLLASLCEVAPVLLARLPWGTPAPPGLMDRLLDRVEAVLDVRLRGGRP